MSQKQASITVARFDRVMRILNSDLVDIKIDSFIPKDATGMSTLAMSSNVEGSRDEPYSVNAVVFCDCPDFQYNQNVCKHLFATLNRHNTDKITE